jgi:hypothetical protein
MEQVIRRGSRGSKPVKVVTFDEAEEAAEHRRLRPQISNRVHRH